MHIVLPRPARVRISVHDMLGRERIIVSEGDAPAGVSTFAVSAAGLAPGVYLMLLQGHAGPVMNRFLVVR